MLHCSNMKGFHESIGLCQVHPGRIGFEEFRASYCDHFLLDSNACSLVQSSHDWPFRPVYYHVNVGFQVCTPRLRLYKHHRRITYAKRMLGNRIPKSVCVHLTSAVVEIFERQSPVDLHQGAIDQHSEVSWTPQPHNAIIPGAVEALAGHLFIAKAVSSLRSREVGEGKQGAQEQDYRYQDLCLHSE